MNPKTAKLFLLAILLFVMINFAETTKAAPEGVKIVLAQSVAENAPAATINFVNPLVQQTAPDAVVRNLYKAHTPDKSILDGKSRQPLDKFFDKNLADLIWKDLTTHTDEVGVIDFDPFYNAQDFEIKNLVVGRAKINGAKATVPVTFTNFKRKNLLTYSLVRQNGWWKISDVRYDAKNSLLGYFKEDAKN